LTDASPQISNKVDHVTSKLREDEFNESDLSKLGKFKCDLCTEMFSSETNLVTHQELKHDLSIGGKIQKIAEFEKQKEDFHVNIANV